MKHVLMVSLAALCLVSSVGCSNQQSYSTVKVGPDRYTVSGNDPNRLQGNAYQACKEDGYVDYTVVNSDRTSMTVRCEKEKKSLLTTAGEVWTSVKEGVQKQVDDLRKDK